MIFGRHLPVRSAAAAAAVGAPAKRKHNVNDVRAVPIRLEGVLLRKGWVTEVQLDLTELFNSLMRDDDEFAATVARLMARRHRATIEMFERCVDEQPASPQPGRPLPAHE